MKPPSHSWFYFHFSENVTLQNPPLFFLNALDLIWVRQVRVSVSKHPHNYGNSLTKWCLYSEQVFIHSKCFSGTCGVLWWCSMYYIITVMFIKLWHQIKSIWIALHSELINWCKVNFRIGFVAGLMVLETYLPWIIICMYFLLCVLYPYFSTYFLLILWGSSCNSLSIYLVIGLYVITW